LRAQRHAVAVRVVGCAHHAALARVAGQQRSCRHARADLVVGHAHARQAFAARPRREARIAEAAVLAAAVCNRAALGRRPVLFGRRAVRDRHHVRSASIQVVV
jgi:hypothetical protein